MADKVSPDPSKQPLDIYSENEEGTDKEVDRQDLLADHGQQGDDIKVKGGAGKPAQDGKGDFAADASGVRWAAPLLVAILLLVVILLLTANLVANSFASWNMWQISSSTSAILRNLELDQKIMQGQTGHCPVASVHQAIETGNGDAHSLEAAITKSSKSLPCIIRDAPSQVGGVKDLLIERLKTALSEENYTLRGDQEEGPAIAFVVNGSRLEADLKRDLRNVPQRSKTILVVFKPTNDPRDRPEKVKPARHGFDWVEEAVVILIDINNKELHNCDTNTEAVNALIRFLK